MTPTRLWRTALVSLLLTLPSLAWSAELVFRLDNPPSEGTLVAQVYGNADRFGGFREPDRREVFRIDAEQGEYRIGDLPAGDYALLVYWDENDNGLLDRNFIGIPREPIALSNQYRPKGPPSFERARVRLAEDESLEQTLSLSRPLGQLGQWGVGLGVIGQTSPYRGSDARPLQAIPALVYIGERLQWTGPRIRYNLFGSDDWRLALQGDLRLSAYEEKDSEYLVGLGDRETTFMGGMALIRELPAGIDLAASARTDLLNRHGGHIASLTLSRGFQLGNWRVSPSIGVNWLSGALADYEFGVPVAAQTDWRPAYSLSSALNREVGVSFFYELTPGWQLVGNLGLEQLDDAIVDSPIVDQQRLTKGFLSLTYAF
ncbi:MipA/OmpV family protein [Marinimicrobium sp. C2-29]|uniref:MipA/OmpV family protein n=1 Tax=Marinimicrobium sp. C2-29 TaxID=3139825 RepID=UPI003139002D